MKRNLTERTAGMRGWLIRFGFSSLWLAAVQVLSWLACFAVVNFLFGRNHQFEWLVYGLSALLPFLWGAGGYLLLVQYRPKGRGQNAVFLILWTVLPAILCWWADRGGPDILWLTLYPQLMARLAWFYPLFDAPQSAHVLNTLRPLAAAGTHILMMAGFSAGLWARRKRQKDANSM